MNLNLNLNLHRNACTTPAICQEYPQTNGMVERFNRRLAEVLATTRFDSA